MKTKTRFNKLTAWLLPLVMLMTFIPSFSLFTVSAAGVADTWDGTAASYPYASGTGTESDPYIIDTAEQLAKLALLVRGGTRYAGEYFK